MSNCYPGRELELFAMAHNWRNYWCSHALPFVHGHVLEVGGGVGSVAISPLRAAASSWTSIEPDAKLFNVLTVRQAQSGLESDSALNCTIQGLKDKESSFDTILYVDVLEHIKDDAEEVHQARQLLRPRGRIVVIAPAHQMLFSPFDEAVGHFRRYSPHSLSAVFDSGFRRIQLRQLDSLGLLASLGNRVFLRSEQPSEGQIAFWDRVLVRGSRTVDRFVGHRFGKSLFAVFEREEV